MKSHFVAPILLMLLVNLAHAAPVDGSTSHSRRAKDYHFGLVGPLDSQIGVTKVQFMTVYRGFKSNFFCEDITGERPMSFIDSKDSDPSPDHYVIHDISLKDRLGGFCDLRFSYAGLSITVDLPDGQSIGTTIYATPLSDSIHGSSTPAHTAPRLDELEELRCTPVLPGPIWNPENLRCSGLLTSGNWVPVRRIQLPRAEDTPTGTLFQIKVTVASAP
jgi:hypothetical protein